VLFDGRLKQENWEDKNGGGKRSKIVLNVDTMQFLGSPGGSQHAPSERKPATQQRQSKPVQRDFDDSDDSAEVPF
jgi:single-strand DNA-binding protein